MDKMREILKSTVHFIILKKIVFHKQKNNKQIAQLCLGMFDHHSAFFVALNYLKHEADETCGTTILSLSLSHISAIITSHSLSGI